MKSSKRHVILLSLIFLLKYVFIQYINLGMTCKEYMGLWIVFETDFIKFKSKRRRRENYVKIKISL